MTSAGPGGQPAPRSALRRLLVVAGLTGFAISQPLLSVFGDDPSTLAFHGVEDARLVAFALVVAFVPPLVLWLVGEVAHRTSPAVGRAAHLLMVLALVTCTFLQLFASTGLAPVLLAVVSAALGVLATAAYVRLPAVGLWATYTAALPVLAVGVFLVASPSSALLRSVAAPERSDTAAPSVVVIVLDELPTRSLVDGDGQLDATRFPNLAALAADATWYRHHTTLGGFTDVAVPSLLSGTDPNPGPPLWTGYPDNLFTLLAPTHELEVMEAVTRLCPYDDCAPSGVEGTASGLGFGDLVELTRDLWIERVSPQRSGPSALDDFNEAVTSDPSPSGSASDLPDGLAINPNDQEMRATSQRADAFRASFDTGQGSSLYYLHLLLPHQPWRFLPDGTLYGDPDPLGLTVPEGDKDIDFTWNRWDAVVSEQRHLLQAQYADRVVGQVLDDLRASELYEDSLVVVTADHGISFEDRTSARAPAEGTMDAIAYTPLFVKLPGQASGAIDDTNVTAADVVPTIAEELGLTLDWPTDGAPIGSPAIAERGDRKLFYDMVPDSSGGRERRTIEYSDAQAFATVPERLLGPLPDPEDPLSALHELAPVRDVVGVALDDLHPTRTEQELHLIRLGELERPEDAPFGRVIGRMPDGPDDGAVLLAIDDVVVAVSELSTGSDGGRGHVTFLLPGWALDDDNSFRAALVVDGRVTEVAVSG